MSDGTVNMSTNQSLMNLPLPEVGAGRPAGHIANYEFGAVRNAPLPPQVQDNRGLLARFGNHMTNLWSNMRLVSHRIPNPLSSLGCCCGGTIRRTSSVSASATGAAIVSRDSNPSTEITHELGEIGFVTRNPATKTQRLDTDARKETASLVPSGLSGAEDTDGAPIADDARSRKSETSYIFYNLRGINTKNDLLEKPVKVRVIESDDASTKLSRRSDANESLVRFDTEDVEAQEKYTDRVLQNLRDGALDSAELHDGRSRDDDEDSRASSVVVIKKAGDSKAALVEKQSDRISERREDKASSFHDLTHDPSKDSSAGSSGRSTLEPKYASKVETKTLAQEAYDSIRDELLYLDIGVAAGVIKAEPNKVKTVTPGEMRDRMLHPNNWA